VRRGYRHHGATAISRPPTAYLPYNPYARDLRVAQDLRIANKTGFFMGVRCDAAIMFLPGATLVVIALTKNGADQGFQTENENAILLGRVGHALFSYFKRC
jgi:hypothetical protein